MVWSLGGLNRSALMCLKILKECSAKSSVISSKSWGDHGLFKAIVGITSANVWLQVVFMT